MTKKNTDWMVVAMVAGLLYVPLTRATDAPQLILQAPDTQLMGKIHDGTLITRGRVVYQGDHVGFQVWSESLKSGRYPNYYLLTGEQSSQHILRVRIEKDGWQPDDMGGKGIVIHTGENTTVFNVVVDGEQTVMADHYLVELKIMALLP